MNELLSLQDLFNKKIFRIPDYQRGYSWTNQQLNEFWEDIVNLPLDREHYTGMISLKKLNKDEIKTWVEENWLFNTWGYNAYHIVDGQQRLTSFVILINEIVSFYKGLNDNKNKSIDNIFISSVPLNKIIEDYLVMVKPDSEGQLKTYKFGYEVDNPSYEFFKHKVLEEPDYGEIKETFYTLNLEKAKIFFAAAIKELYDNGSLEDISNIFVKLTQRLKFNLYNINDDFNVFIAFETMNNRGKKLSNLELLKNRLIYLSTLFKIPEDLRDVIRNKINDTWKEVYSFLGKNKGKALNDDEFLQAHWIIYFGYTRKAQNDYASFLLKKYFTQRRVLEKITAYENIETNELPESESEIDNINDEQDNYSPTDIKEKMTVGDIGKYIDSMKALVPYWYYINFPKLSNLDDSIKNWLDKLNRLGYVYFKPLTAVVLYKYDTNQDDFNKEKVIKYLKTIERFIFMHFRFASYNSTFKNSYYYRKANDLYFDKVSFDDLINEITLIEYLDDDKVMIQGSANSIINNFMRLFKNYKGYYSWSSIRYFLYEYENYLMGDQANVKIYPDNIFKKDERDKVSIEHVYPQTATNEYWAKRFNSYSEAERGYLNGSLGNLLPLSLSINSQFQNDSFIDKKKGNGRRGYSNGSHSEMEVSRNEEWTPQEILDRGLKMLDFMSNRWDFNFRTDYDKIRFLGIEFMSDEEPEEVYEDEIKAVKKESKITQEMTMSTYDLAKKVHDNFISMEEALNNLEEIGMNRNSASMYIDCFQKMIAGELYKRGTSVFAADYYISKIQNDYGDSGLEKATRSLSQHIDYLYSKGFNNIGLRNVLKKYTNNL